jgi:hypothetical protein
MQILPFLLRISRPCDRRPDILSGMPLAVLQLHFREFLRITSDKALFLIRNYNTRWRNDVAEYSSIHEIEKEIVRIFIIESAKAQTAWKRPFYKDNTDDRN